MASDEYIKLVDNSDTFNFKGGSLNVILDPNLSLSIRFDESSTDFSFKGSGHLDLHYQKPLNNLVFNKNFEINGSIDINIEPSYDTYLNSVSLSNAGVFKAYKGNMEFGNVNVSPFFFTNGLIR